MTYKDNKLPNYKILISDQILYDQYDPTACWLQIGCKGELDKQCKVFEGPTGSDFIAHFSYCSDGCNPIEQSYQKMYYSYDGITWGIYAEGNVQPGNGFVGFWLQAHIFPKIIKIQWFDQEEIFYTSTDKFGWVCAKNIDPSLGCIQQIGGKYDTKEQCETDMNCYPTTPTPTITPTATPTVTPTVTPTATVTPTVTPTATVTPTVTPTATVTPTVTPPVDGYTDKFIIIGIVGAVILGGLLYYTYKLNQLKLISTYKLNQLKLISKKEEN